MVTTESAIQEVHAVMPVFVTTFGDKLSEGADDSTDIVLAKGSIVDEDDARMVQPALCPLCAERADCPGVVSHEHTILLGGDGENIFIRRCPNISVAPGRSRNSINTTRSQSSGDSRRNMDVKDETH